MPNCLTVIIMECGVCAFSSCCLSLLLLLLLLPFQKPIWETPNRTERMPNVSRRAMRRHLVSVMNDSVMQMGSDPICILTSLCKHGYWVGLHSAKRIFYLMELFVLAFLLFLPKNEPTDTCSRRLHRRWRKRRKLNINFTFPFEPSIESWEWAPQTQWIVLA